MSIHPGRARALLPVLAASGLLLTGCGGQDAEPAPTVTTTVVRTPEASPSTEPTQTTSSPRSGASEGSHHSGSGSPSSAKNPIVEATDRPSWMAHIDAPLPRCATTTRPAASVGAMRRSSDEMKS